MIIYLRIYLAIIFITSLNTFLLAQTITCNDVDFKFLWDGQYYFDGDHTYACFEELPQYIEIVNQDNQSIPYAVTWTGLQNNPGEPIPPGAAHVTVYDFFVGLPFPEWGTRTITAQFTETQNQNKQHTLSLTLTEVLSPYWNSNLEAPETAKYTFDKNTNPIYPTYNTLPKSGIPFQLISNMYGSYSDVANITFTKSAVEALFGYLFCNNPNVTITPNQFFQLSEDVNFEYTEELSTNTLEVDIYDCAEPSLKLFLGKTIQKTVDFVYVQRRPNDLVEALDLNEIISQANVILNKVGVNLTLGKTRTYTPYYFIPGMGMNGESYYDWQKKDRILSWKEQWSLHKYFETIPELESDYLVMLVDKLKNGTLGNASSPDPQMEIVITNSLALHVDLKIKDSYRNFGFVLAHELGHAAFGLYHTNIADPLSPIPVVDDRDYINLMLDEDKSTTGYLNSFQFKIIHDIR